MRRSWTVFLFTFQAFSLVIRRPKEEEVSLLQEAAPVVAEQDGAALPLVSAPTQQEGLEIVGGGVVDEDPLAFVEKEGAPRRSASTKAGKNAGKKASRGKTRRRRTRRRRGKKVRNAAAAML